MQTKTYRCRIQRLDTTGDTTVATFDPDVVESVEVAQNELTAFLDECVKEHGEEPPVWARKAGHRSFDLFDPTSDDLTSVEDVVIHQPLVGG